MMADHFSIMSPLMPTEAAARTHVKTLRVGMQSHLKAERRSIVGAPELPRGCEAWIEDGMRFVIAFAPFFCVGMDDDGEPIYDTGWLSRVDVLTEQAMSQQTESGA